MDALGWERARVAGGTSTRAVLAGAPNAGKSTLFNRLASGAASVLHKTREKRGPLALRSELGPRRATATDA